MLKYLSWWRKAAVTEHETEGQGLVAQNVPRPKTVINKKFTNILEKKSLLCHLDALDKHKNVPRTKKVLLKQFSFFI